MRKLKQLIEMVVAVLSAGVCVVQTLEVLPVQPDFRPEQAPLIVQFTD